MKIRTIEDIYSKEIGWKPFARFIDLAKADNYDITNIKEYNEKYKFELNGYPFEFSKDIQPRYVKDHYEMIKKTYNMVLSISQTKEVTN